MQRKTDGSPPCVVAVLTCSFALVPAAGQSQGGDWTIQVTPHS